MNNLLKGKIPPQAPELEEAVLGAVMIDDRSVDDVMEIIKSEVFFKTQHKLIFKAIKTLYQEHTKIDLLTVSNQLRKDGTFEKVGGDIYIIGLTQGVSSSAHIEFHCRILLQKFIARELIKNSNSIIENAYDEGSDALKLLDSAFSHLGEVSNMIIPNKQINIRELAAEIVEHGGKVFRKEVKPGLDTPITNFTNRTGGWRNGELIIFAARPGMGKTSFALLCAWKLAIQKIPVAFFSLEMSDKSLLSRTISMDCKIEGDKFNKDGLAPADQTRITSRMAELGDVPLHIDDTSNLTIHTLSVKAKKLKKEKGIKLLIIDYLQLMSGAGKGSNREQDISTISRGLKTLAMELDIPIIALSQLSRAVEMRGGMKRPMLSDLRESGAIEQDADMVVFYLRPEYYGIEEWDDYDNQPTEGEAEYIVAKNRNGGLVRNRMRFIGKYTLFADIDDEDNSYFQEAEIVEPAAPKPISANEAFGPDDDDDSDVPF